jgi:hypothetical protein
MPENAPPMDTLAQLRAGRLAGLRRLDLSCGLTELPREVFGLADTLEVLNLSGNALATLPVDLGRLHRLRVLFCSDNRFAELPESIGLCPKLEIVGFKANRIERVPAASLPPSLRWLILTDNRIEALPEALGRRDRLQKLMLAGNRLQHLPESLADCTRLELLRIAANRFDALPAWLPELPRLAWLAYAGNPFCDGLEAAAREAHPITPIAWQALQLQQRLGEGASGVIHQAAWQAAPGAAAERVAVKLFKGAITSDGLPRSEMAACIAAGAHPNLIALEGEVRGHPEGRKGLVMRPIDAAFANLAGPPSLDSCTRDVYAEGLRFDRQAVLGIARGIASATRRLHARGVLHGDLYAHNILCNGRGDSLLGDFGAASFLPARGEPAAAMQRIEARAFGILLGELLDRCDEEPSGLRALQAACKQPNAGARPLFDEIDRCLGAPVA